MTNYYSLQNYYKNLFILKQEHNWSMDEVNNLMPFERDIMLAQLNVWIRKRNEQIEKSKQR